MRPAPRPDAPGRSAAVVLVGLALALGGADEARAAPAVDHNRGSWFDSFLDPFGLAPVASGLTQDVVHDPIGARLLLAEGAQAGFFTTGAITPASLSTWGKLAVDRSVPSGTEVALWLYDPAADLLYGAEGARGTREAPPPPLKLGAGADPSLREEATIAFVPTSVASLRIYGRLSSNDRLQPAVNALRLTWTPRATLSLGAGAMPGEVPAGGTVVFEVRVAVSHVDASGLVVTLPLPTALANPRDQDQRLAFVSATEGGAPDASGAEIVWRLGQRKAGQTFSLRAVLRVPAGLLDGTVFQGEAFVHADNARKVGTPPWSFTVRSAPQLRVDRTLSDLYAIDGAAYAFSASRHEARLWVENGGVANETLFDGLVVEDLRPLLATSTSPTRTSTSTATSAPRASRSRAGSTRSRSARSPFRPTRSRASSRSTAASCASHTRASSTSSRAAAPSRAGSRSRRSRPARTRPSPASGTPAAARAGRSSSATRSTCATPASARRAGA